MSVIIGLALSLDSSKDRTPRFYGGLQYFRAIKAAGGVPVGLPLLDEHTLRQAYERMNGILLMGGGDVAPQRYGESPIPELGDVEEYRDELELALIRWAREDNKPLLAICRGIQILNVAYGGTLYQDLEAQNPTGLDHRLSTKTGKRNYITHKMSIQEGTRLYRSILEKEIPVNSMHHQAIKEVGKGLTVTGWSEDGIIEAVEDESNSWIVGIQCHPEELWEEHSWARRLFESFIREAAFQANRDGPDGIVGALVQD